jgi:predicted nuclease of restriction endonuclease-like RecB superfamily
LDELAREHKLDARAVEAALYADLKGAHVLASAPKTSPERLLEHYERAGVQAVLLRAAHVSAIVTCSSAAACRELFRALKFRRLLHRIERLEDGRYRIEIDGPFSLFESVTKYGLQLALVLPALEACDKLELSAKLRWGKLREPLEFRYVSARAESAQAARLPDDVQACSTRSPRATRPGAQHAQARSSSFRAWAVRPRSAFSHAKSGRRVSRGARLLEPRGSVEAWSSPSAACRADRVRREQPSARERRSA